ncbi:hypothetical protein Lalb_Chr25g0288181 [Lupinus albus]|uniref:Uncharacterized protein n=1 Tax=Lupinus albus TaxID=3870 RepID=A0A6A4MN05_LUPAL|nr:hypothetical protein Lalb_Chr25g0288181 [Lupinus albus]
MLVLMLDINMLVYSSRRSSIPYLLLFILQQVLKEGCTGSGVKRYTHMVWYFSPILPFYVT